MFVPINTFSCCTIVLQVGLSPEFDNLECNQSMLVKFLVNTFSCCVVHVVLLVGLSPEFDNFNRMQPKYACSYQHVLMLCCSAASRAIIKVWQLRMQSKCARSYQHVLMLCCQCCSEGLSQEYDYATQECLFLSTRSHAAQSSAESRLSPEFDNLECNHSMLVFINMFSCCAVVQQVRRGYNIWNRCLV